MYVCACINVRVLMCVVHKWCTNGAQMEHKDAWLPRQGTHVLLLHPRVAAAPTCCCCVCQGQLDKRPRRARREAYVANERQEASQASQASHDSLSCDQQQAYVASERRSLGYLATKEACAHLGYRCTSHLGYCCTSHLGCCYTSHLAVATHRI